MKRLLILLSFSSLLASCAQMVAPPYTTVEKIARVNPGMSYSEVATTLGIPPFDIYHMSGDGSTVHIFNYKLKERKNKGCGLFMKDYYAKEDNLTTGGSFYTTEQKIYVLYNNGKLASMISDAGREDSENLIVQNNTIQFLAKTERHGLMYEKLDMGESLIRLDSRGNFDYKRKDSGILGGATVKKEGFLGKGCLGGLLPK